MEKDFPSHVFPHLTNGNDEEENNNNADAFVAKKYSPVSEKVTKLSYKHPTSIIYQADKKSFKCLTQKNYADNFVRQKTPLLPWRLPNPVKKKLGYDVCFDFNKKLSEINLNEIEEEGEDDEEENAIEENRGNKRETGSNKKDTELEDYFYAECKSTRAKFFPALFSAGNSGKCIYTTDGLWLTPCEFQSYSGSTAADWRERIKLITPNHNNNNYNNNINFDEQTLKKNKSQSKKKSQTISLKNLVDNKWLKIHTYRCDCSRCLDSDHLQSQNVNLLGTFFLNSGNNLVICHPDMLKKNTFTINMHKAPMEELLKRSSSNLISDLLRSVNKKNLSESVCFEHKIKLGNAESRSIVKQLECRTFDEDAYFFPNTSQVAENVNEAFISLNLNEKKVQSYLLSLNDPETGQDSIETRLLYEVKVRNDRISSIAASPMIRAECAVLLSNSGDLYLTNEDSCARNMAFLDQSRRSVKIASNLQALFASELQWRSVSFGAQPRQFIYSDHSQVFSVDARIKTLGNHINKEIFKAPSKWLDTHEIIHRCQLVENDFNCHLICCSNTLLLVDERFPNRPLLSWPHFLRSPLVLLNNIFLPAKNATASNESTNLAFLSDGNEVYAHQFSLRLHEAPVSHNYTRKYDSPIDLVSYFSENYDKRLANHFNYRLRRPIVGLNALRFKNSFALFQDIFYECFEINDKEDLLVSSFELNPDNDNAYNKWIDQVKAQVFKEASTNIEAKFDEMSLKESDDALDLDDVLCPASEFCRFCNFKQISNAKIYKNELCHRCGHSAKFTNKITSEHLRDQLNAAELENERKRMPVFDLNKAELESHVFTASLLSIWNMNDDETTNDENELSEPEKPKRYKFSLS